MGAVAVLAALAALAALALRLLAIWVESRTKPVARSKRFQLGGVVGHRGGRETTPENTLLAFENCVKHAQGIELDVWLTKDRKVVVFHDGTLRRMCKWEGHVRDYNYLDLPAIRKGPSEGFDQGSSDPATPDRCRIPLFSEVLDLLCKPENAHVTLILEVKGTSRELARMLRDMVEERGIVRERRVVWFSLSSRTNAQLLSVAPHIPRVTSVAGVALYVLLFRLGLLPLCRLPIAVMGITTGSQTAVRMFSKRVPGAASLPGPVLDRVARWYVGLLEDPALFRALQRRGVTCVVLGVNDGRGLRLAEAMGADTVITDRPEWCAANLVVS